MCLGKLPVLILSAIVLAPALLTAQHAPPWKPARLPDGHPDFQGTWVNNTATPFFRPAALADKATLSDEDIAVLKQRAARLFDGAGDPAIGDELFETLLKDPAKFVSSRPTGDYNSVWLDEPLVFEHRTSQIVDPPTGRLPALSLEGQRKQSERAAYLREHGADGPEDRLPRERCIVMGAIKVGFIQSRTISYFQIVQTSSAVVLQSEANHDSRLIALDRKEHLPPSIRRWLGDSRGWWDGDTLVVETTNFHPQSILRVGNVEAYSSEHFTVVERLTLLGPDTMQYGVTVTDPTTWTRPWTAMTTWQRSKERMFEDACHEGNYGLEGILRGARAEEKERDGK